ncbi:retrotransposon protein, putative, ty1-copia subclass, partial [Tanacetum coccineum]
MEWYRNLQIMLSTEDKLPFLEQPIPTLPVSHEGQVNSPDVVTTHQAWVKARNEIARLMVMPMDLDIQKNLEHLGAYDMLKELKTLYVQEADQELLLTVQEFHACKQEEGQSVSSYVLKMKSYIDTGNSSNCERNSALHTHGKGTSPPFAPKPKNPPTPKKDNPAKDAICHQCGEGLKGSRKLKPGALSLYVGDGHRAAVEAIGEFHLCLPSGLVLILHNCHYAPSITRGIISVSRLYNDGFVNRFENENSISVSRNNLIYFNDIPRDDIYEIVLSSPNTNDSSMYVVSNKRAKLNLDSALLWHCNLRDISKKRIEKLQHDGLLDSTDIKSFKKCVSYMSGKMARKPYSHQMESAKDLFGLMHIDVCGPFKIMSRQAAYYFVTFTDDFSRYGYVYLLKHKHEVFETFKLFQKEVENQLGKTIKSLRFDRGGEYISQEFFDHLKEHRIIAHRTPPYTPQHNGVSERRNQTLLDMVRSIISQTTLPKSFWDYVLESDAHILNMVPTKKVDKTPYKNSLIAQEESGSLEDLEIIQEEDTHPSIDTSLNHKKDDQEIDEPQKESVEFPVCMTMVLLTVWDLVDLPPNGKTVRSKWLFKKKTDMDGAVYTYKARLVAKGFIQTPGIDYEEAFSPVAYIRAIRILIAIVAFYDYEIWQMDVKPAFLNGYLTKEVYMEQPDVRIRIF